MKYLLMYKRRTTYDLFSYHEKPVLLKYIELTKKEEQTIYAFQKRNPITSWVYDLRTQPKYIVAAESIKQSVNGIVCISLNCHLTSYYFCSK